MPRFVAGGASIDNRQHGQSVLLRARCSRQQYEAGAFAGSEAIRVDLGSDAFLHIQIAQHV